MRRALHNALLESECKHGREKVGISETQKSKMRATFVQSQSEMPLQSETLIVEVEIWELCLPVAHMYVQIMIYKHDQ